MGVMGTLSFWIVPAESCERLAIYIGYTLHVELYLCKVGLVVGGGVAGGC